MSRRLAHDWFPVDLPDNVRLGDGAWLYSTYAFRHYRSTASIGVEIGRASGVYAGSFFDLGPKARVRIGDFCTVVGAIFSTDGEVEVGDHALIAHQVVIADRAAAQPRGPGSGPAASPIFIGANAWIGARSVLLGGALIGENAIVGAGSVIDGEVPPGAIAAGNPARIVGAVPD